jgi:hypothetical protein
MRRVVTGPAGGQLRDNISAALVDIIMYEQSQRAGFDDRKKGYAALYEGRGQVVYGD